MPNYILSKNIERDWFGMQLIIKTLEYILHE